MNFFRSIKLWWLFRSLKVTLDKLQKKQAVLRYLRYYNKPSTETAAEVSALIRARSDSVARINQLLPKLSEGVRGKAQHSLGELLSWYRLFS